MANDNWWERMLAGGAAGGVGGFALGGPIGSGIGMLGGGLAGLFSDGGDDDDAFEREFAERQKPATFLRAPEYPEATGARGRWWEELQEGYLPEDWGDIWERAKQKYSQYYWGGPGGQPGVAAKVKASAARRGVSESPALEAGLTRMGMEEAGGLRDIDIAEITAGMGERQNWFQQLRALAGMQVPGAWDKYGGMPVAQPTQTTPWGDLASAGGEYLGTMGQTTGGEFDTQGIYDWISGLGKKKPTAQESITGGPLRYEDYAYR